jgi:hypothetical protein
MSRLAHSVQAPTPLMPGEPGGRSAQWHSATPTGRISDTPWIKANLSEPSGFITLAPRPEDDERSRKVLLVKLAVLALLITVVGRAGMALLPRVIPEVTPRHAVQVSLPEVLVVSRQTSDHAAVILATQPRGYKARQAETANDALESLQHDPDRIGIVLVDDAMEGSQQVISAVQRTFPAAHLVILTGTRDQGTISSMLVNAGMN